MKARLGNLRRLAISMLLGMVTHLRADYKVTKDIDYLAPPSAEKADLYLPTNPSGQPQPAILVIHGGGWVEGDKQSPRELSICNDLANHGFVVLAINYTLFKQDNPASLWPTNLHQCKTAVRWLRKNATQYQIDPDRIGWANQRADISPPWWR